VDEALPPNENLERLGAFLRALTDPARPKIRYPLGQGELRVFDLSASIGASLSPVSHHASLQRARPVKNRRGGRIIHYAPGGNHASIIVQYAQCARRYARYAHYAHRYAQCAREHLCER
jgi:hypothetical protein